MTNLFENRLFLRILLVSAFAAGFSLFAGITQDYPVVIFAAIVSLALGFWAASKTRRQVVGLAKSTTEAADGNYEIEIEENEKGEVGILAASIRKMIRHVKDEIAISHSLKLGIETPLFTTDKDSVITYINGAACEVMRVTTGEVVGKLTVKELFGTDRATRSALSGSPAPNYSVTLTNKANESIPVLASSGPIRKADGEIVGAFLSFFDLRANLAKQRQYLEEQIKPIADAVRKVESGDLTARVHVSSDSQLVELGKQIEDMIENLRLTLLEISGASSSIAAATAQISSSTEELAAGAQEQSAQTAEVATAVEEMTKTVYENSKNATMTAEVTKNNGNLAEEGSDVVIQTVKKIKEIAEVVQNSASTVERLGTSTQEIGEIVLVINDIADQTNLLALNAAIEAARAGEEGRGFAVVADEVRKLAERTTHATKQIAAMIKNVQREAAEAVSSMKRGSSEVSEGIMLADKAGESLKNIVKDTKRVVDMMMQIAAASEEQSATSNEISRNVEAISSVSGQSASGISQIAGATDNLNKLTDGLVAQVHRFHLGSGKEYDEDFSHMHTSDILFNSSLTEG